MYHTSKAFTLVELIVMIIVIGALGIVTIPKYIYALRKSRAAEAPLIMDTFAKAEKAYYTENQKYLFTEWSCIPRHHDFILQQLGVETTSDYFFYSGRNHPDFRKSDKENHFQIIAVPYGDKFRLTGSPFAHWIGLHDDGTRTHLGYFQEKYIPTWN